MHCRNVGVIGARDLRRQPARLLEASMLHAGRRRLLQSPMQRSIWAAPPTPVAPYSAASHHDGRRTQQPLQSLARSVGMRVAFGRQREAWSRSISRACAALLKTASSGQNTTGRSAFALLMAMPMAMSMMRSSPCATATASMQNGLLSLPSKNARNGAAPAGGIGVLEHASEISSDLPVIGL